MTFPFYLPSPLPAHNTTFHSRVPKSLTAVDNEPRFDTPGARETPDALKCSEAPVVVGVDEAGRGPVLGPMVYAAAYCTQEYYDAGIMSCGFADSKKLTDERRRELLLDINANDELGYVMTYMTSRDISSNMLAPWNLVRNLNEQAHSCTMDLIQALLDKGLNVQALYVDTVGPPDSYQRRLAARFPTIGTIRVEKKADDKFPIVSGASVCAKVSRDEWVESLGIVAGSGYPGDPNTKKWLRDNVHPYYGWSNEVRYSWSTARELLKTTPGVIPMEFEGDNPKVAKVGLEEALKRSRKGVGMPVGDFVKF